MSEAEADRLTDCIAEGLETEADLIAKWRPKLRQANACRGWSGYPP